MPRTGGRPDSIGATYEGDVLNGRLSVQQAHERVKEQVAARQASQSPAPTYARPEDYDPVLPFHCRLDEPKR